MNETRFWIIAAFTEALAGSGKPFIATSGTGLLGDTGDRVIDRVSASKFVVKNTDCFAEV